MTVKSETGLIHAFPSPAFIDNKNNAVHTATDIKDISH
jgi:hypothetical protein